MGASQLAPPSGPRTDAPGRSSERSNATARLLERRGSNRGRESGEPLRGRERLEPQSYEHRGGEISGSPWSARRTKPSDESSSGDYSEGSFGESVVKRKLPKQNGRHSTGVKLGSYDGSTCLQTFLALFENYSEYFEWDEADKLFHLRASLIGSAGQILWYAGKQSTVGRILALLKARFDSENQAERFGAELRSRKRTKDAPLQKLYEDVRRLMSLAYPGESSVLSDIIGRDAFLVALDDQALRVRILEKELKNFDDALNMASRLQAFDIMGSTGQEAEKNKSRFARAAVGGKESTVPEGTQMSEEILRQLADVIVLISSFRRDPDRQQQEITTLKVSYKPPYSGKWNLSPAPHPAGAP